jgi:hypothetical protein
MRFVSIGTSQKITELVNDCVRSRKFSFGLILLVILLSISITLIQTLVLVKLQTAPPISPLASAINAPHALGTASESAELVQNTVIPTNNLVNDTKPEPTVKKTENNGIGTTKPPTTHGSENTQNVVSVTANIGRINFANNKFGIYTNNAGGDIDLAADLVNSNGGDWGWILIPMSVHENGTEGWNSTFGKLAEKHLIPIVQLIEPQAQTRVPTDEDIDNIAKFLADLNWPIKLRVVSAFNEMNASEYWGGKIDPEGYARTLNRLIDQLKQRSSDFFVMNGAFNASAQTGDPTGINCIKTDLGVNSCYLSEIGFLKRMDAAVPGIFKKLDGWAAHTYPHPAYRGRPTDSRVGAESTFEAGRNTIRSYQFEQRLLKRDYGLTLPVFITETGWPHKEGQSPHGEWYDASTVADYYKQAFVNYFLKDPYIVAVTPFLLTGSGAFSNFSFIGPEGNKFPQWDAIAGIKKVSGDPPR